VWSDPSASITRRTQTSWSIFTDVFLTLDLGFLFAMLLYSKGEYKYERWKLVVVSEDGPAVVQPEYGPAVEGREWWRTEPAVDLNKNEVQSPAVDQPNVKALEEQLMKLQREAESVVQKIRGIRNSSGDAHEFNHCEQHQYSLPPTTTITKAKP